MIGRLAAAALLALLAGCNYRPGYDDPIMQSLSWFSYVGSDDLRAACTAASPDRFRIVYNGDYQIQTRAYDITAEADGGGVMKAHVRGTADLTRAFALFDPLAPWQGQRGEAHLTPDDMARLRSDLEQSGLMRPGPDGLRLVSNEYYWVAVACIDGVFHLNAWKYPSARYEALSFPAFLLQHDPIRVAIDPPVDPNAYPPMPEFDRIGEGTFEFRLADNRLIGASAAFGE